MNSNSPASCNELPEDLLTLLDRFLYVELSRILPVLIAGGILQPFVDQVLENPESWRAVCCSISTAGALQLAEDVSLFHCGHSQVLDLQLHTDSTVSSRIGNLHRCKYEAVLCPELHRHDCLLSMLEIKT